MLILTISQSHFMYNQDVAPVHIKNRSYGIIGVATVNRNDVGFDDTSNKFIDITLRNNLSTRVEKNLSN